METGGPSMGGELDDEDSDYARTDRHRQEPVDAVTIAIFEGAVRGFQSAAQRRLSDSIGSHVVGDVGICPIAPLSNGLSGSVELLR